MHPLLDTQLRSMLGIASDAELASFLRCAGILAEDTGLTPEHATALRGLGPLLEAVATAYIRQNERFAAAEARLHAFVGISSDWYWEHDEDYRFTMMSSSITQSTGDIPSDFIGKTWAEAFGGDPAAPEWIAHQRMLDLREPFRDLEFSYRGRNGNVIHISVNGNSVFDDNHRFTGYRGIARNITARKIADKQLQDNLRFIETLLDSLPHPVTVKDREHRIVRVNAAYARELGRDRREVLGKTALEFGNENARDVHEIERQLLEKAGVKSFTRVRRSEHGKTRYHAVTKASICDAQGAVTGFITTFVDITDLKAAEIKAEEQLRLTSAILESSPAPMMVKDRDRIITYINSAYETLFGVRRSALLYRTMRAGHADADVSIIEAMETELLANPGTRQIELKLPGAGGREVFCIITKSTYMDASGTVGGLVTTYSDISALKQTEENLIAAKQAAEVAVQVRSQFLANMSHEIRTPMNGVLGMTNLLQTTLLNQEQREFVSMLKMSGEALLKIISDILDFSKIEAGKVQIDPTVFDLRSRVTAMAQLFAASARERNLQLTHEVASDVPQYVLGDPVRIGQALSNIVANAIKFTQAGSVLLGVSVAARDGDDVLLQFTVVDTGIGIPPEALERIFNPFSQADSSTTRRFGGTGLGLTISRELVQLMGGEIQVESVPDAGSRFSFTVKVQAQTTPAALDLPAANAQVLNTRAQGSSGMVEVLLAEDNKVNQMVARRMLENLGCRVTVASDGAEAVDWAARQPFDLILMDCHMPNMDGYAATAAIRAMEKGGNVHRIIVAQTANAMEGDRDACLAASMDDYITKPFTTSRLADIIKQWVHGKAASPSA